MAETTAQIGRDTGADDGDLFCRVGSARSMLTGCVLLLVGIGVVMVFSTSAGDNLDRGIFHQARFIKHLTWVSLAIMVFFLASGIDYRIYRTVRWPLLVGSLLLLVAVLLPLEHMLPDRIARHLVIERNGARRWLRYAGIGFQPSEVAKLVGVLFAAAFMSRRLDRIKQFKAVLLPMLLLIGLVVGLVVVEPDLGTAFLIALVLGLTMLFAGVRLLHLLPFGLAGGGGVVMLVTMVSFRMQRLVAFMDPEKNRTGRAGYQVWQALVGLGSGGPLGKGIGAGMQKLGFLPEAETDFVFAILGEEAGMAGCLLVALVFVLIAWQGMRIAAAARDAFGSMVAFGLTMLITLQAMIHIAVVTASMPTKGIPLPFVSYGGSSLVTMMAAAGIICSIARAAEPDEPVLVEDDEGDDE